MLRTSLTYRRLCQTSATTPWVAQGSPLSADKSFLCPSLWKHPLCPGLREQLVIRKQMTFPFRSRPLLRSAAPPSPSTHLDRRNWEVASFQSQNPNK